MLSFFVFVSVELSFVFFFFFQAEDGIRDIGVTGVQTCALPISKLIHVGATGRIHGSDASIVDFNRCGTPLAEIVTEPDLHTAEDARAWLELLRTTLRQTGVSDVNMEEGSLRCDANISLRPMGSAVLGTKTELKNMNSFRFIERGIR